MNSKTTITQLLKANDIASAVAVVAGDRKAFSILARLAYDKDSLVGWRAILVAGLAARELVRTAPEFLRDTCRKLLWSLNDESGGIGWSAPELLGEIVSSDAKRFTDMIPLIAEAYDIEGGVFKAGVVYALARIGAQAPDQAALYRRIIDLALADTDPLVRLRGLELVGRMASSAAQSHPWSQEYNASLKDRIAAMTHDKGESWIYGVDDFVSVQVGEKAMEIIKTI